ncbi:hypothetical protein VNI00_015154 [Paramarasmius palmivorus]|uniref:Uncharacterized protein n=1 Tax=Paramarasmius palmivorus TaxID=297713 RepID=A0AAW0BLX5_9AGAR
MSVDLAGKVALVTGASSKDGIGWNVAHQLALQGAKVYIHARDETKVHNAIREMELRSPRLKESALLHPFVADFSNFRSVKASVEDLVGKESRLDILVNNAALPTTSSAHAMLPPGIQLGSLEDFNQELNHVDERMAGLLRYALMLFLRKGLSKLANILFAKELQRRLSSQGIDAISLAVHPGPVATDGSRQFFTSEAEMAHFGCVSPEEGAKTTLFAATDPLVWTEKEKYAGAYLVPPGVIDEPSDNAKNEELGRTLWDASEKVLRELLP